jgi:hypothetical protein
MDVQVYKQIAERAISTFVQAFLAVFLVADVSSGKEAAVAGVAAVLSVAKSAVLTRIGDRNDISVV